MLAIRKLLTTKKFTGTGTVYAFLNHVNKYRQWTAKIETASKIKDVVVTVPSQTEIVSWLVESYDTVTDQGFVTLLKNIKINKKAGGKTHDFEKVVATLKPACPVMKRRKEGDMDEESGASNGKKRK